MLVNFKTFIYICTINSFKKNILTMAKELIETSAETAQAVLELGNRKITLDNGWAVEAVNLNNQTCKASKGQSSSWFDNEKVKFFIHTTARMKTVF